MHATDRVRVFMSSLCLIGLVAASSAAQDEPLDPNLPHYESRGTLTGTIRVAGSDTMHPLAVLWARGFRHVHKNVVVEVRGEGSATAVDGLVSGLASLGMLSRPLSEQEVGTLTEKFGSVPVELTTAVDLLAVCVHRDNPIAHLTLGQVDAVFSAERRRGERKVARWGDLGLKDGWASRTIRPIARDQRSGTGQFFRDVVLQGAEFADQVEHAPSGLAMARSLASDPAAIGFLALSQSGLNVRALPLAESAGGEPIAPDPARVDAYPLRRPLVLALARKKDDPPPPLVREFLRYVFSQQGQEDVIKEGFIPINAQTARLQLEKLSER